jgi:hypothetical protein
LSIIPVRVPAALMPVLASDRRFNILPDHPLYEALCPVCGGLLGETIVVPVFAGIEPESRKPGGFTTGAAVAVHAFCAGVPVQEPEAPPRTVTFDLSDDDTAHVLDTALKDYANQAEEAARRDGGSFTRWAAVADRMREQAEAAGS